MTRKEAIAELKSTIKQLAQEQKEEKKVIHQDHSVLGPDTVWSTFTSIWRRKIEINAHLNIYAEMRGKDYRHYSSDEWMERATKDREGGVRREFAFTEDAPAAQAS